MSGTFPSFGGKLCGGDVCLRDQGAAVFCAACDDPASDDTSALRDDYARALRDDDDLLDAVDGAGGR